MPGQNIDAAPILAKLACEQPNARSSTTRFSICVLIEV
jgi:hypothetical protein